jgi:hypothetical protein
MGGTAARVRYTRQVPRAQQAVRLHLNVVAGTVHLLKLQMYNNFPQYHSKTS